MTAKITAIVPAAGVGSRMQADRPKQYLILHGHTVLEHTVEALLRHPDVGQVVVAVSDNDPYFGSLTLANHPRVVRVSGGKERADSVLSALDYVCQHQLSEWVLVHDAARPCVEHADISQLIATAQTHTVGAILAAPVRDTMKRADGGQNIDHTVDRVALWHALTPQMFRAQPLMQALTHALAAQAVITDEASAFEWLGQKPALVAGRADNIKITQPEDLALAEFYLSRNYLSNSKD
ncbi:2-C-methyl-D-erythritol 4-phosphate cytidylyltransferase [Vibrio fluvialis]|uniref:2-C-methyl-D-erythritol 4-phosphate cytidylyltransferase n=1 Tax=Vibrio fluvialis TaxID=676 RepID=A0AAX2LV92_VIBFL|nr:2-C-methyl-D-erythritol 4-phosphate cytidylyltransferase [Vibrio fluvialis]AMF95341.1 2-C-methyl-D-erythritol 4-phosphate cytidylyltransferase [Vibrio fluvialis]EKO4010700.1 2-C-methyl-D-erythritol 4-phosphate cytidylyltransferase [Vibrio fluvialis]MBY8226521.1 2-C-methyl-D-erythritol 4-phosphate cytidylyltransferase [Vibrio fluvialis]MCE7633404.1 2-C-methyl-D-erythritol 4-phosphate cytidylyltransferase [Vibrio fluvialis]SUP28187.1 4-diphosphocytidyl-2C-methyl-D-erythritol synthase [Vibrio 